MIFLSPLSLISCKSSMNKHNLSFITTKIFNSLKGIKRRQQQKKMLYSIFKDKLVN